jgi:dTDP-4-dehydrorhamnose 3,5-epimerase
MQIKKTKFEDLLIINKNSYKDNRGFFKEIISEKYLKKKFIFDYISFSKKNVLRGLHIQTSQPQGKLITVFQGRIFDVALDLRKKSKTYGKIFKTILSDKETNLFIYQQDLLMVFVF